MVKRVFVTGVTGFIGQALARALLERGDHVAGTGRRADATLPGVHYTTLDLARTDLPWPEDLRRADVVVHLASLAHIAPSAQESALALVSVVNVDATLRLARAAAEAGVRRFVFLSSIGVHGPVSTGAPLDETSSPAPHTPYGRSKWQAEQALRKALAEGPTELVIVRPPLVYGPGAPGNLGRLLRWIAAGRPLPLSRVVNRRTLVARDNLVHFLLACIDHPAAANETFVVGDDHALSTPALVRALAEGMGRPERLWPIPVSWLRVGARLLGRRTLFDQLCGNLEVNPAKARQLLGWVPPLQPHDALRATGRDHLLLHQ